MRNTIVNLIGLFITLSLTLAQSVSAQTRVSYELVQVNGQSLPAQVQLPHPQLDVEMTITEGSFELQPDGSYQQTLVQKVVVRNPRTDSLYQRIHSSGTIEGNYQWSGETLRLELTNLTARKLDRQGRQQAVNQMSITGQGEAHREDRLLHTRTPDRLRQALGAPDLKLIFRQVARQQSGS